MECCCVTVNEQPNKKKENERTSERLNWANETIKEKKKIMLILSVANEWETTEN